MELKELTARAAARAIAEGEITAEEYAEALLDRSADLAHLGAFIWQDAERVREWAREADGRRAAGDTAGPLNGVPLAIKDNIEIAGLATTAGTPAFEELIAQATAPVVQALWDAGALLLGKTNMHELAMGPTSINHAFGAVGNPYAPDHIAGGSSGGTGAAVAGRMAPAGLGTDTACSVRGPSAICGLVGLRPTQGRYSQDGIVPLSHTRDTAGPMTRDVADAVLLDGVITGEPTEIAPASLQMLRLGVPRGYYYENLDSEVARLVEAELERMRDLGVTLIEMDFAEDDIAVTEKGHVITRFETPIYLPEFIAARGLPLTMGEIAERIATPVVKEAVETQLSGRGFTLADYRHAMEVGRPRWQQAFESYMRDNDVQAIVFPTLKIPARTHAEETTIVHNGREYTPQYIYNTNSGPGSIIGVPGLSLPIGLTAKGLPVGIELDSRPGRDRDLLAIGLALEHGRTPLPAPPI